MSHADTTLLTAEEAVKYSPSDEHLSGSKLSHYIRSQEEHLFNTRFGWGFYELLRNDRYSYALRTAGLPADDGNGSRYFYYEDDSRTDIVTGDFVLSEDVVYKAINDIATAGISVANIDYYQRADRFQTACHNTLWNNYLRVVLATSVVRASLVSRTFQDTQRGAVKQYKEGESKPLSAGEVERLKAEHQDDIERLISNMERHIKRNSGSCFSKYGILDTADCGCGTETDNGLITTPPNSAKRIKNHGFSL